MEYDALLDLVKKRRSCRDFRPDPVPDECIEKIIEAARWAPSGANTQPWDFVVVKREELRQRINAFVEEHGVLSKKMDETRNPGGSRLPGTGRSNAPVFIILVGDPRTIERYPVYSGLQRGQSNLDASLANAFIYMHLAAASLGLGSGWLSSTRNYYVQVMTKHLLGIPRELTIFDTMTLGYPASDPSPRNVKSISELVHYDRY
jgi:5,6-dimethylbenzimidazole synthase